MKLTKRLLILFLLGIFLLGSAVPACADDSSHSDPRFDGKTWDEVIADFIAAHSISGGKDIGIGYVNLVTGEEHYVNADQYMVTASMYKVPINMLFSEKVYNGEISMDTYIYGFKYSEIQYSTIVYSSNDMAEKLWNYTGNYRTYRRLIAPYMGEDPDNVDRMYYVNNYFTPAQMIYCLSYLYNNQEHFPGVIDCMLEAEPDRYFRASESRYTIAHKYGYLAEGRHTYVNDCAIVWTDDPIAIVVFTDNCAKPYAILSDFISLMIDYTQYQRELRLDAEAAEAQRLEEEERQRQEAEAREKAEAAAREAEAAAIAAAVTPAPSDIPVIIDLDEGTSIVVSPSLTAIVYVAILVVFLIAVIEIFLHRKRINTPWALLAALSAALAMVVCVYGARHGTVVLEAEGDPDVTVVSFFDDIVDGNYTDSYTYLADCSDIGLGCTQSSEAAALIQDALQKSYSYELYDVCRISGMTARRVVLFTYLDLDSFNAAVQERIDPILESVVADLSIDETYDANGDYLSSVTDDVYLRAVRETLEHAYNYYETAGLVVTLNSIDGSWYIVTDSALLSALTGGLL